MPRRSLSSVRRQAQQQAAAQVEPAQAFLENPTPSAVEMPVDPDATVAVPHPELAPLSSLPLPGETKNQGLNRIWGFIEDFSEWFVRGVQSALGVFGVSVLSGLTLALRGLLVLTLAGVCVYAGSWFGRTYGPALWGGPGPKPVVPPQRILPNTPEQAKLAVSDLVLNFYSDLNQREYKRAYAALSPAWQKALSFETFRSGYSESTEAACDIKGVRSLSGSRYQVEFVLDVVEKGKQKHYKGTYIAVQSKTGWKLDEGDIRE